MHFGAFVVSAENPPKCRQMEKAKMSFQVFKQLRNMFAFDRKMPEDFIFIHATDKSNLPKWMFSVQIRWISHDWRSLVYRNPCATRTSFRNQTHTRLHTNQSKPKHTFITLTSHFWPISHVIMLIVHWNFRKIVFHHQQLTCCSLSLSLCVPFFYPLDRCFTFSSKMKTNK